MENIEVKADRSSEIASVSKKAFIFGIIADVLCWTGLGGIIFGILAMKNGKLGLTMCKEDGARKNVFALIGRILGIVALIAGIIFVIYWAIIIIAAIVAGVAAAAY